MGLIGTMKLVSGFKLPPSELIPTPSNSTFENFKISWAIPEILRAYQKFFEIVSKILEISEFWKNFTNDIPTDIGATTRGQVPIANDDIPTDIGAMTRAFTYICSHK